MFRVQVILRAEATKYVCLVFFHNVNYGSSFPPPGGLDEWERKCSPSREIYSWSR